MEHVPLIEVKYNITADTIFIITLIRLVSLYGHAVPKISHPPFLWIN